MGLCRLVMASGDDVGVRESVTGRVLEAGIENGGWF